MKYPFIWLIKVYKLCISPLTGSSCRFEPSCSEYALQAFEKKSFFRALILIVKRLSKCHPFHPGGKDEIP
jgi:uncharacterized protein